MIVDSIFVAYIRRVIISSVCTFVSGLLDIVRDPIEEEPSTVHSKAYHSVGKQLPATHTSNVVEKLIEILLCSLFFWVQIVLCNILG